MPKGANATRTEVLRRRCKLESTEGEVHTSHAGAYGDTDEGRGPAVDCSSLHKPRFRHNDGKKAGGSDTTTLNRQRVVGSFL